MEVIRTDENGKPHIIVILDEDVERQLLQILQKYGFIDGDAMAVKRDMEFLRKWRRIADACRAQFWKTLINAFTLGLLGLLGLGVVEHLNGRGK